MEDLRLYDIESAEFSELIDNARVNLKKKNLDYKKLNEQVSEILENYQNILSIIEDNDVENLNEEECKMLQKLIRLNMQMTTYEDIEIFFLGAKENYLYFKKMNLIKE